MRNTLIIIALICLVACKNAQQSYEKVFYEKISSIKIPENCKVLESIDNGEFVTATVFQMDSLTLNHFVKTNHFDTSTISLSYQPLLFSKNYFRNYKPEWKSSDAILVNIGTKGKNSWEYVIDPKSKLLWAEIQYPDWGGK